MDAVLPARAADARADRSAHGPGGSGGFGRGPRAGCRRGRGSATPPPAADPGARRDSGPRRGTTSRYAPCCRRTFRSTSCPVRGTAPAGASFDTRRRSWASAQVDFKDTKAGVDERRAVSGRDPRHGRGVRVTGSGAIPSPSPIPRPSRPSPCPRRLRAPLPAAAAKAQATRRGAATCHAGSRTRRDGAPPLRRSSGTLSKPGESERDLRIGSS